MQEWGRLGARFPATAKAPAKKIMQVNSLLESILSDMPHLTKFASVMTSVITASHITEKIRLQHTFGQLTKPDQSPVTGTPQKAILLSASGGSGCTDGRR